MLELIVLGSIRARISIQSSAVALVSVENRCLVWLLLSPTLISAPWNREIRYLSWFLWILLILDQVADQSVCLMVAEVPGNLHSTAAVHFNKAANPEMLQAPV